MTTYSWTVGNSGDWNIGTNWTPSGIPNDPAADVIIDAVPITTAYTITIAAGASDTVHSLTLNPTTNLLGVLASPYKAAVLEIDGTLTFAAGSDGTLGGPLQNTLVMNNGTIVNGGTINAFIQALGNNLFTGTNGVYITNWLQALGTVTIDTTSIAEMTGTTLFDGIFEAKGPGATVNLGGKGGGLAVDIVAMEGPPLISDGWTELLLNAPGSSINEWNGTTYVSIEQTLATISARATLDVLGGRDYTTANKLTLSGGVLNLAAGTVTTGGIAIQTGGEVKGSATIAGDITNAGTILSSGAGLVLTGSVSGSGALTFDAATGTLELGNTGTDVTVTMLGGDVLKLDQPGSFAGTIAAHIGDTIQLNGITADSAVLNGGTLVVSNGTQVVASLHVTGDYSGDTFSVGNAGGAAQIGVLSATTGYVWLNGSNGDWNTATNWASGTIPNAGTAAVTIDATPVTTGYTVTIAKGSSDTIASLALNGTHNAQGVLATPYKAATLEVDGTLTFAAGSSGAITGPAQSLLVLNGGSIANAGTISAAVQAVGTSSFTGSNTVTFAGRLDSAGTVTIDTATIGNITGSALTSGTLDAASPGAIIDLGGKAGGLTVNVATIQGAGGSTAEVTLNGTGAAINEWTGTTYTPIEQSLTTIGSQGVLDVLGGRDYTTTNALTIAGGGLLNLTAGTVTASGLTVQSGGEIRGNATIAANIANAGTILSTGAGLVLTGSVTGAGTLTFDSTSGTLELGSVGAGETVAMLGGDVLKLDQPGAFAGSISAKLGDTIVLQGVTADSAVLNGNTLVVSNGTQVVADLQLTGSYIGSGFTVVAAGGTTKLSQDIVATTYTWANGKDGDWNTAANWSPAAVPNGTAANVVIDTVPASAAYTVTIAAGASDTVQSLVLNGTNNALGVLATPFKAAILEVDGTLAFAAGSDGTLQGPLQNALVMSGGTIVNAGTVNAFVQAQGVSTFTGTNGIYFTNWLQALGTVTIDTKSIAEMTGTTLFDGIFEAKGPGATINLGGKDGGLAVDITTVEGPPLIPGGWTELLLNDTGSAINEWNGTTYVPIEQTLATIASRGTVDVLAGRNYTTTNTLTIAGGLLNLAAGTVTAAGIAVQAGGEVKGSATIAANITNAGTVLSSGAGLVLNGSISGSGALTFDSKTGTLAVGAAGAGVTVTMLGGDRLLLNQPLSFAGTIAAQLGDQILLQGVTADHAVLNGSTLVVSKGTQTVASLHVSGDYTGEQFAVTMASGAADLTLDVASSVVCFLRGTRIQTPSGEVPVEELKIGQTVVTAWGGTAPIVWIGRRRIDSRRHPEPSKVWPVRIRAGAFGPRLPLRDLYVSPQHALYLENVLIPAKCLVNGLNVEQEKLPVVEYYHIELPRHDLLLAEGLAAESYLENGDRATFENGGDVITLHPDLSAWNWDARACAELKVFGPELETARATLRARARQRRAKPHAA